MNTNKQVGFTKLEVLTAVCVAVLVLITLVSSAQRSASRSQRMRCANNLKQIGLAFKTRSLEHGADRFFDATNFPVDPKGRIEVFKYFQVQSNECADPKVLICPADHRRAATNLLFLSNENLSYAAGLDATASQPQLILTVDRNLTNGSLPPNHVLTTSTNYPCGWTAEWHGRQGNVGLADGSVQQFSSTRLREMMNPPQRLAFP